MFIWDIKACETEGRRTYGSITISETITVDSLPFAIYTGDMTQTAFDHYLLIYNDANVDVDFAIGVHPTNYESTVITVVDGAYSGGVTTSPPNSLCIRARSLLEISVIIQPNYGDYDGGTGRRNRIILTTSPWLVYQG